MVCGAYMLMVWAIPDERDRPQSVAEAKTLPMVQKGADLLKAMVPAYVIEKGAAVIDQGVKTLEDGNSINETIQNLAPTTPAPAPAQPGVEPGETGPTPAQPEAPGGGTGQTQGSLANPPGNPGGQAAASGYKDAQRNDLDRLIESSQ
jgi:membrane protein required for colicin V production